MSIKTLKRILFGGIFKKNMNEDLDKIKKHTEWLNTITSGVWIAASGTFALTEVQGENINSLTFFPSKGIIVKVFMNTQNGEMRIFPANMFEKNAS